MSQRGRISVIQVGACQSPHLMALAQDRLQGAGKADSSEHMGSSESPCFPTIKDTVCFGNKHLCPSSGGLDAYTHGFLLSSVVPVQAGEFPFPILTSVLR